MGVFRWCRRRQRWTLLAGLCLGVIGLQVMLFHMDRRRKKDGDGDHQHSMDYHRRRDAEAEAVLEDLLKEHQGGKVLGDTMGLVQNGAKRKRLQALPESELKTVTRDQYSRPIISHTGDDIRHNKNNRIISETVQQKDEENPRQKPSFKIYIYDLPARFNSNLTRCVQQADDCYQLDQHGMGPELRHTDHLAYRNTHQHSLEVILHHKLLQSEHRTLNPEEADAFYIPFYPAISCACKVYEHINLKELHTDLWRSLSNMPYYSKSGHPLRPHFMTLGTIERDHWSSNCPLLRDSDRTTGITFIGVEKEINNDIRKYFNRDGKSLIVAPYPSFGHFDSTYTKSLQGGSKRAVFPEDVSQTTRDIRIFMAASSRKGHDIRVILKRKMNGTSQRYSTFSSTASKQQKTAVWLNTPECRKNIELPIVDWMRHSVFCLQPPGISPTRKSFYDAIMAGCIPVTFKPRKGVVRYPFQDELDYGRFTYNIPLDDVLSGSVRVIERLKDIPNYRIKELQKRLVQVAPSLQYSYPPAEYDNDAMKMIIDEMKKVSA